ncbi:YqjF family protein [Glycomyces tarimensis]
MAEPVTPTTPRPVRLGVLAQWWRQATFVHWAVDPDAVRHLLPAGARPDLFNARTYVGLVAFEMHRTRVLGTPPLPYLGSFPETNVRLYSVDESGRRGVVFLSMDASRLVPVAVARAGLRLPYRWSQMRMGRRGDRVAYTCRPGRIGPPSRLEVRVGEPIETPSALELFLTARWGLHHRGRYLPSQHAPWRLHQASLLSLRDHLVAAAGLPGVTDAPPDSVLFSPGVYARFGPASPPG